MSLGYLARIGAFTSSDAAGNPFFDPGNAAGASGDLSTVGSQLADSSQGSPFDFLSAPSAPPPSSGVASTAKSILTTLFGNPAPVVASPGVVSGTSSSGLPSWLIPLGGAALLLIIVMGAKKKAT